MSPATPTAVLAAPPAASLPGRSSIKSRVLHHVDDVRFAWLTDQVSTRPPISVEVHLTNRCNLTCDFCTYGQVRHNERIPIEVLDQLVGDLVDLTPPLRSIVFSGGGEPTLHSGLPTAIHTLANAGIDVGIITNGVRVTPALHEALQRCAWVRVSLDTPHSHRYQAVMSPRDARNFDRVLANVTRLNHAKTINGPIVGYGFIIDRHSQDDASLLRCLDLAADTGCEYAMYRPLIATHRLSEDLSVTRPKSELDALAPAVRAYADRIGIAEQYDKFVREQFGKTAAQQPNARDHRCPIVSDGLVAFIAATGLVYPCYALYMNSADRHDVAPIGDLRQQRFTSIWDGPLRHDVVTAIDATRCPYCRFQGHNTILWNLAEGQAPGYQRDDHDPHRNFL